MLVGLYDARLKETCLFFMPKELKTENEIKAVLDRQLSREIKEITTSHDSFETVENRKRAD